MARILANQKWYEQVEPSTFYEYEFESRVILHARSVYPEYQVVVFKKTVISEYGSATPDLAFISRDYSEWRVVEIEMGYHSLSTHVEPQVQCLASAMYGDGEAEYLCRKADFLDRGKMTQMIRETLPQVLVIVNEPKPDWEKHLSKYGAVVAVFELFRSQQDYEIFRVNGEYPTLLVDSVSQCSFHPITPRFLEIHNPEALDLPRRGKIKLRYNNCMTEWERVDADNKVWLGLRGRNPLSAEHRYEIARQSDDTLVLRRRTI